MNPSLMSFSSLSVSDGLPIGSLTRAPFSTGLGEKHMQDSGHRAWPAFLFAKLVSFAYGQSCMPISARALPNECVSKGTESAPQKRWLRKDPNQRASWYRLRDFSWRNRDTSLRGHARGIGLRDSYGTAASPFESLASLRIGH